MSIAKIQSGDTVKVIAGNYKGTVGQVTKVTTVKKRNTTIKRVAVSTVPKIAKYFKANKQAGMQGVMTTRDRLIDISNIALIDEAQKVSKVKIEINKAGKKIRVFKTTGALIPKVKVEKPLSLTQQAQKEGAQ